MRCPYRLDRGRRGAVLGLRHKRMPCEAGDGAEEVSFALATLLCQLCHEEGTISNEVFGVRHVPIFICNSCMDRVHVIERDSQPSKLKP